MSADSPLTPSLPDDGRQSATARGVQRGVCGLLVQRDFAALPEFVLASGRRADIAAIDRGGHIWIVEIKSSVQDFRADGKWPDYREYCDAFFFAVPPDLPTEILPEDTGLIIADAYGADIVRDAPTHALSAARRKAVTLRFARAATGRLMGVDGALSDFA